MSNTNNSTLTKVNEFKAQIAEIDNQIANLEDMREELYARIDRESA